MNFHLHLRRLMSPLTVVLLILISTAHAQEKLSPGSQISTVLLRTDHSWDGAKYNTYSEGQPELTVLKIIIPPRTTLPWHRHLMPNAAHVISGTLHVESKDGKYKTTLNAGDVLPEMVGRVHRGWTEDVPVEIIVFYAGVKDMMTAIEAQ